MDISTPSLPDFIRGYSLYQYKVEFRCTRSIEFLQEWYYEPRYALGVTLKRSQYSWLYDVLFSPREQVINGKRYTPSPAIMVRVLDSDRMVYTKNSRLEMVVSIISNQEAHFRDMLGYFPDWGNAQFFRKHGIVYTRTLALNPHIDQYEIPQDDTDYLLDINYLNKRLIQWNNVLGVEFKTPTSYKVNGLFTKNIPYNNLINRISKRAYETYCHHLYESIDELPSIYNTAYEHTVLKSDIHLPGKATIKSGKKYDLAGITGTIYYQAPYDVVDSYLLTLGSLIHIGSHTGQGNGHILVRAYHRNYYDQLIHALHKQKVEQLDLTQVITELKEFSYLPLPYRAMQINKSDGGHRTLHIAHSLDLTIQKEVAKILHREINHIFVSQNYAYRKGKGAREAIEQVMTWRRKLGDAYTVIRCDIDDFYDTISIDVLLNKLFQELQDPCFLHIIELWIRSGIIDCNYEYQVNKMGIPQGSAISPILANLYLHEIDVIIKRDISKYFIRYADDIIILVPNEAMPIRILQTLTDHLQRRLSLRLNNDFFVGDLRDSFSFLGLRFLPQKQLDIDVDKKHKLPQKITNSIHLDAKGLRKYKETIKGMKAYYGVLLPPSSLKEMDKLIIIGIERYLAAVKEEEYMRKQIKKIQEIPLMEQRLDAQKYIDQWMKHPQVYQKDKKSNAVLIKPKKLHKKQHQLHLGKLAISSEIVVVEPGAFVGTSRQNIRISKKGKTILSRPIKQVRQISIMNKGISISSNVSKICEKNNIQITYYDAQGKMYASLNGVNHILPSNMEAQLSLSDKRKKIFIQKVCKNKVKNQRKLLQYHHKYYKKKEIGGILKKCIVELKEELIQMPSKSQYDTVEELRSHLFLWEARCAQIYWKGFASIVNQDTILFTKREKQGAPDIINQMLNYGYAILMGKVARLINMTQISPNISYLHARKDRTPTLCFDLMEQYRSYVVDRSIMAIITKDEKVTQNEKGNLSLETRKKIISKINDRWLSLEQHKGKDKTLENIAEWQVRQHLKYCQKHIQSIQFYTPKW